MSSFRLGECGRISKDHQSLSVGVYWNWPPLPRLLKAFPPCPGAFQHSLLNCDSAILIRQECYSFKSVEGLLSGISFVYYPGSSELISDTYCHSQYLIAWICCLFWLLTWITIRWSLNTLGRGYESYKININLFVSPTLRLPMHGLIVLFPIR